MVPPPIMFSSGFVPRHLSCSLLGRGRRRRPLPECSRWPGTRVTGNTHEAVQSCSNPGPRERERTWGCGEQGRGCLGRCRAHLARTTGGAGSPGRWFQDRRPGCVKRLRRLFWRGPCEHGQVVSRPEAECELEGEERPVQASGGKLGARLPFANGMG